MSASIQFRKIFTKNKLQDIYYSSVRFKAAVGIDGVNRRTFESQLENNIDIIYRKVINGTYNFSPYREKLISKGPNKYPRVISIPTIRDKLTLKALYEIFSNIYGSETPFVHKIIDEIAQEFNKNLYDGVIKLDVKNFYPSIEHGKLFDQIKKKIRKNEILTLIDNAIKQPTLVKNRKDNNEKNLVGVPQGLSISNMLANVYFLPIDQKYTNKPFMKYFRYVDDILILCDCNDINKFKSEMISDCKELGLEIHSEDPDKTKECTLFSEFQYLGYKFEDCHITVRRRSVDNLRESIIRIFTKHKYSKRKNIEGLIWEVNLRITGCIFNQTKYGWLFFFSKIDNLQLLGSLDHFVKKQIKRFNINVNPNSFKKFLRAFHEITKNLTNSHYIPNFDLLSNEEKAKLLRDVFRVKTSHLTLEEIEFRFNQNLFRNIKDLEKDLAVNS